MWCIKAAERIGARLVITAAVLFIIQGTIQELKLADSPDLAAVQCQDDITPVSFQFISHLYVHVIFVAVLWRRVVHPSSSLSLFFYLRNALGFLLSADGLVKRQTTRAHSRVPKKTHAKKTCQNKNAAFFHRSLGAADGSFGFQRARKNSVGRPRRKSGMSKKKLVHGSSEIKVV